MQKPLITIVSGLPRSGTSMMMRMLSEGGLEILYDEARPADQDNPLGYYEYQAAKRLRSEKGWLDLAIGKAVKVISFLLPELPTTHSYQILFMRRHLKEVLASQQRMLEHRGEAAGETPEEAMAVVYEKHLTHIQGWLAQQDHMRVRYVDHRDVLLHPEEMAQEVNAFLGGALNPLAMARVVDPALHRQRVDV